MSYRIEKIKKKFGGLKKLRTFALAIKERNEFLEILDETVW